MKTKIGDDLTKNLIPWEIVPFTRSLHGDYGVLCCGYDLYRELEMPVKEATGFGRSVEPCHYR